MIDQAMHEPNGRQHLIIAAGRRLSLAATELKAIEGMSLEPDELSDAWEHAYAELYRANEEFIRAIGDEPKPEKR